MADENNEDDNEKGYKELDTIRTARTGVNKSANHVTPMPGRRLVSVDALISNPRQYVLQVLPCATALRITAFPVLVLVVYISTMFVTPSSFEFIHLDADAANRPLTVKVDSCDVLFQRESTQTAPLAIAVSTNGAFNDFSAMFVVWSACTMIHLATPTMSPS